MTFTDDDLKWLKSCAKKREEGDDVCCQFWVDGPALLARLEAAEACAEKLGCIIGGSTFCRLVKAWRKAAGK